MQRGRRSGRRLGSRSQWMRVRLSSSSRRNPRHSSNRQAPDKSNSNRPDKPGPDSSSKGSPTQRRSRHRRQSHPAPSPSSGSPSRPRNIQHRGSPSHHRSPSHRASHRSLSPIVRPSNLTFQQRQRQTARRQQAQSKISSWPSSLLSLVPGRRPTTRSWRYF